jgi:hypothetical protein
MLRADNGDDDEGENEDEAEDSTDRDGLHRYHGATRNFVEKNSTPAIAALGVELEVYSTERGEAVRAVRYAFPDWYLEHDGSLDDSYGFEIITQPLGVNEWAAAAPRVISLLQDNETLAYSQPDPALSYGIHVNVSRSRLSPLQEARMLMFMRAHENASFIAAIAQRAALYGSDAIPFGSLHLSEQTIQHIGGLASQREHDQHGRIKYVTKPMGNGKYSAIHMHDSIAEFRLFQSTLHLPSFMKNLEFVWALIEWTDTRTATGSAWDHIDFVAWLGEKRGGEQRYPHLFAFLRKPSYMGKKYPRAIPNTWAAFLPKQTTKSMDILGGEVDLLLAA